MYRFFAWCLVMGLTAAGMVAARSSAAGSENHRYRQTCGPETTEFVWKRINTSGIQVQTVSSDEVQISVVGEQGDTFEWRLNNTLARIKAVKQAGEIRIEGMFKNQPINETHAIDARPWFQTLSYSLSRLIQTQRNNISFWMIRPDNLTLHKMSAGRLGPEDIPLNGKVVPAERIQIRLAGMLGAFWSGDYWFRRTDGVFIRYRGVHGPPGTPATVVQLLD